MVQFNPVPEVQNRSHRQCDDFNRHCGLIQLELRGADDVKSRQKRQVVQDPIEREKRVYNYLNQSPVLIL